MNALKWHKAGDRWIGIEGKFRAEIRPPHDTGLQMWYWSLNKGGSGGDHSVRSAKRSAQDAVNRTKRKSE